jgi:exonuclease III
MRILTWNCNGAFRKKYKDIQEFKPDICIIQECENPEKIKDKDFRDWSQNFLWTGENINKGLGVFANKKIKLEPLNWESHDLKYFLPCRINDEFNLIGVWCHTATTFAYIGQLWKYLELHKSRLGQSLLAGDFNSNVFWDKKGRHWNHSDVVRELSEIRIESLYHKHFREEQGMESRPTFYLQKNLSKPYHLDYIFASEHFFQSCKKVSVGSTDRWLVMSDHMPVFCEW